MLSQCVINCRNTCESDNVFYTLCITKCRPLEVFQLKEIDKPTSRIIAYTYKIIPLENADRVILTYIGIPLRRISDYINWCLNQCKADPENIHWSLLNSHSSIYQYNGYSGHITEIEWEQNKKLPSNIVIQISPGGNNSGNTNISKLPYQLFQGCQHFVVGRNKQYKARMALEHIGYQVTETLVQYIETTTINNNNNNNNNQREKTILTKSSKLERYDQQFDNLIGSNVRLHFEQLQKIGEIQNKQLMRTSEHLTQIKQQHTKNLLVVSCSATKVSGDDKLPALLRYAGITYGILKSILLGQKWPLNVDLFIVSAKYGLLTPFQPIPFYDQQITPEIMEKVSGKVNQQLNEIDLSTYSECFVNLSKMYSKSIAELYNKLESLNCHLTRTDNYKFQRRNLLMINWLEQRYSEILEAIH